MAKRPDPVDVHVGQNIRIFRTAKKMSQSELGKAIGVTFQQVQKYEKGTNRVGSSRLSKIADILGVPVNRFFEDGGRPMRGAQGADLTQLLSQAYAVRTLQALANVPPRSRLALVTLIESMAQDGN